MPQFPIASQWSIDLDESLRRLTSSGNLILWKPGRTVHASAFRTGSEYAEQAIARIIAQRAGIPKQTYDREEPGLIGHACLLPETEGTHHYWGLSTWTAVRGSMACVTFYFESIDDLPWALAAWHTVRQNGSQKTYLC